MKKYFYKKEYKYIYLSKFCYSFANALIETFGTVMLYKAGIPIYLILLIYGFRFGIMGFSTPIFMTISSKLGIAKCALISNTFSVISSYIMLNSSNIYQNIIIFTISMGLLGISNPMGDALSSKYVETEHRGRFNSFLNIVKIIGAALASCIVAWGVLTNKNKILFILIPIFFFLDYLFALKLDYKIENKECVFKSTLTYMAKSKSKYKIIYALRTNHIIERQFLPLYLFIILQDFALFSSVIILSLVLQIVTVALIGKYADKDISKSNNLVSTIRVIITAIFLFVRNKVVISLNKTVRDNFEKVYETSILTSIQNIIKQSKENNELLSAVGQMSLCFTEVVVFIILAGLSKFIGEKIFIVIFILSIISTVLINRYIKEEQKIEVTKE